MPMRIIRDSRAKGADSIKMGGSQFTGEVWADPMVLEDGFAVMNVMFTPCARTHWHTHVGSQTLIVTAGSGWICDKGGEPHRINVGDVIWCPPGTTHWHGGDKGSYMLHTAITDGAMKWHAPVSDEEYNKAVGK